MEANSQGPPTDEKKLVRLKHQKLSENLDRTSCELEAAWHTFAAADVAWAAREAAAEAAAEASGGDDVERGTAAGLQLQETDVVAQAEVDFHAEMAEAYTSQVAEITESVHGLQRAMVDLAEHTRMQGETLDGIEASMGQPVDKTEAALDQLYVTENNQRRNMRWMLCLFLTVASVSATMVMSVWH